jgi:hypothetical protein
MISVAGGAAALRDRVRRTETMGAVLYTRFPLTFTA